MTLIAHYMTTLSNVHEQGTRNRDCQREIHVFRTNIRFKKDVSKLSEILDADESIFRWTVDLTDIDKVLRMEVDGRSAAHLIEMVGSAGFSCEELPD